MDSSQLQDAALAGYSLKRCGVNIPDLLPSAPMPLDLYDWHRLFGLTLPDLFQDAPIITQ